MQLKHKTAPKLQVLSSVSVLAGVAEKPPPTCLRWRSPGSKQSTYVEFVVLSRIFFLPFQLMWQPQTVSVCFLSYWDCGFLSKCLRSDWFLFSVGNLQMPQGRKYRYKVGSSFCASLPYRILPSGCLGWSPKYLNSYCVCILTRFYNSSLEEGLVWYEQFPQDHEQ